MINRRPCGYVSRATRFPFEYGAGATTIRIAEPQENRKPEVARAPTNPPDAASE